MLILFDVDGVLVHSRAYHLGLQKAVAYFSRRMGVGEHTLTQAEIDLFEAQTVTVEWESSAISVAALLIERLRAGLRSRPEVSRLKAALTIEEFWIDLDTLAAEPRVVPRPDFAALARRVGALALAAPNGAKPSRLALELFQADLAGAPWAEAARPLLRRLLAECYDVDASPTHQIVQNFALGHHGYQASYGLPAYFESPALLETADTPLLSPGWRSRLLAERAASRLHCALYTARPSRPPVEVADNLRGYTPEAEMALQLVGLPADLPIIAFGKLEWAARQVGLTAMDIVKPSPVQALAAIAAARTGRERAALEAALAVERGGPLPELYQPCQGEAVHVFEDSASSLRAAAQAVALLNAQGLGLRLVRHGVAPAGSPKRQTLAQTADVVHDDIDAGLAHILG